MIDADTRMLILCSPHNPVGRVWTRDELERLGEFCERRDLIVLSDEIHMDLTLGGRTHVPFASISPALADRTVTCVAPSKTFNLAEPVHVDRRRQQRRRCWRATRRSSRRRG